MASKDKKQEIMDVARATVQAHGYNALSFRDIAKQVGVKSASVHYHFPTKGDLGAALARRYTEDGAAYLDALLDEGLDRATCLRRYTDIFRSALINDNRMCLCGIMAAEHADLPTEVRTEVDRFTDVNVDWLVRLTLARDPACEVAVAKRHALALFAAVEGAQLVSRSRNDVAVFDDILETFRENGLLS